MAKGGVMPLRVAIVGAGCSGLACIKACLDEGLEPVCFEKDSDIGGLWNYSEEVKPESGSVYNSCVINTSKEMMAFSDFPVPKEYPPFLPHKYVLKYFRLYAEHFNLRKYIKFNTGVQNITPADDYNETGRWKLVTWNSEDVQSIVTHHVFDSVMVCTGHHVHSHVPSLPGLQSFSGVKIHSREYKRPEVFENKKALVVGVGNSAVDIAVDLSRTASQVYLSTRRGAWVISRMGPLGIPADALANSRLMFTLPLSWLQWVVELIANYRFDHENYGLRPLHRALEAHPTINDELPHRIMVGAVQVRPAVHSFTSHGVTFEDGTREDIDAVILATGYKYKYDFIHQSVLKVDKNETSLYKYILPPNLKHPTLAVIGLVQAIGAVIPISEMQARWYTRVLKGFVKLPTQLDMMCEIEGKREAMSRQYVDSQRHTLQTFWIQYMDELAAQIEVKPNFRQLLLSDPWLAVRCFIGPCVPAQYRLNGPGMWKGAPRVIRQSLANNICGTKTRVLGAKQLAENEQWCSSKIIHDILVVLLVFMLMRILCIFVF